ncbi:hypothetical protein I3842_14G034100 [Carya illinoinensis]|uniref:PGG domain-containing protein n=1 Tax=Carya illinoinensis TaxID=32201 RepID=A0A922AA49_CARIL|nr:hypothetical protein I3842_14G034100 [Carya illinoinensis]KAG6677569.1 hypothetical protein I3842_14G034100 [Carya illinoinensis]
METKSTTAFSAAIPVLELLDKHNNYPEWAIRMRTYLKGQDLWKVIIDKDENAPTYENDDVDDNGADDDDAAAPINVFQRNYMALHVIQISCGPDAFSEIRTVCSAKAAWQILKKKYLIVLDTGNIDKSYLQYADLYRAVHRGNLTAAKDLLDRQPEAVRKAITNKGQTALHIAVTTGHAHIVKELAERRMSREDLGIEDGDGYTALTTALVYERSELALYLYSLTLLNHDNLLVEKGRKGAMLLNHAIYSRNLDLALHLIWHYPSLTHALDDRGESPLLALASMRNAFPSGNRLVFWKRWIYNCICIDPSALATTIETRLNTPNVESGIMRNIDQAVDIERQSVTRIKSVTVVLLRHLISVVLYLWAVTAVLLRHLISVVLYFWAAPVLRRDLSLSVHVSDLLEAILPLIVPFLVLLSLHLTPILLAAIGKTIKQLYEMKKLHIQSQELLSCMCEEISTSFIQTGQLENIGVVCDAITLAVKNGISEFVLKVARTHPSFLENKYRNSRNLLMLAVLYRQSEIFNHIYHGFDMENTLTSYGDCNDDNILHMVGMIEDSTMLNQISGAALQMQRELQWFKLVEKIVNPRIKESTNKNGLTPRQLFTKNHENMREKGEKWMKGTASSSIVVATLVVTITFASAFTVPGGFDQTEGFPILYWKREFKIFIVLDAMSLFLSSTSVLKFLEVLTTRYTEEDFLEVLLKKMIVGISTLMLSFLTMMMAFFVAVVVMLGEELPFANLGHTISEFAMSGGGLILIAISWTIYFSFPVIYFIWTQFCILRNMIKSTYSRDIFNRKMKLGFS